MLGFTFAGSGANRAVIFVSLTPSRSAQGAPTRRQAVVGDCSASWAGIPGAIVVPFLPPPIQGGATGGFTFELIDKGGGGTDFTTLARGAARRWPREAMRSGRVGGVFTTFTVDDPQLVVTIDREKAKSVGVPLDADRRHARRLPRLALRERLRLQRPRSYRVYVQAERRSAPSRATSASSTSAQQAGALIVARQPRAREAGTAPPVISHYNLFRSVELNGTPAPGVSSGEAIAAMETVAHKVAARAGMGFEWSGISWEELRAGQQALVIFALGLIFVFLVLSAQYESFALPLIIILAVPLALLGALAAQAARAQQRRVLPDRPGHADRPRQQERDPDRRVRRAAARAGAPPPPRRSPRRRSCGCGRS